MGDALQPVVMEFANITSIGCQAQWLLGTSANVARIFAV
jgi:hypothetical protein